MWWCRPGPTPDPVTLYVAGAVLFAAAWAAALVQAMQDPRTRYGWFCVACLIAGFWLVPSMVAAGRLIIGP